VKINVLISLLFLLFSFSNLNAQTYNYSYTDPCTGNVKTIVVPINGSVTVGYYGFVNNFTQQDFVNGTFETWANNVFSQFDGSPCSEIIGLSGTINIAQDVALNTIGVITSLSALMDISNGATDFLSGTLTAASNSSNSKKNNKNNKGNNSQNGSGSNQTNNNTNSNNGNSTTNNNQNQTNGTSNTNKGSTTTTGTNETSSNGGNETTNPNVGTQTSTQAGGTTTQSGTNENGNSQTNQSINNQNNNTNENNSTTNGVGNTGGNSGNGNSTNGEGNTQQGQEVNQNTSSENNQTTTQEGQTTNNQTTTTNGQTSNGGTGSNGNQTNTEEQTTPEESGGQTNITQGATKTINQNKEGGKPTVIASSDFVGFNFQNSEVTAGLKLTGGYHNMRWDGETARGGLVDYVSAQKGPNITGYHAWINKKSMGLLSGTLSVGFEGRGSLYGTLAGGQMFMFPKVPGLKAVYMGTVSYGQVYKTSFIGSAVIAGGMYDLKLGRRFDVKLMGLFVYSPYVSYYNDLVLKSPYVILPTIGTNIAITKRFKFNINGGGAWAIKVNTLNYTITCGTRLLIGQ
jgi:hypothetical protein